MVVPKHKGLKAKVEGKGRILAAGVAVASMAALAVGGTAVAAGKLITSPDIKDGAVHSPDIKDGGVRSPDIRDGGVHKRDLADEVLAELGQGPKGEPGEPGEDGVSGYEVHNRETRLTDTTDQIVVFCPDGKVALGGGFRAESIRGGTASVLRSEPVYDPATGLATGWAAEATATGNVNLKSWVVCATVN